MDSAFRAFLRILGFKEIGDDTSGMPDVLNVDIEFHPAFQRRPDAVIVGIDVNGFLICELDWFFHPTYALERVAVLPVVRFIESMVNAFAVRFCAEGWFI